MYVCMYVFMYVCMFVVIDLKVLVRNFNCESRACFVGNPRESFFFRESNIFFAKVSRKLDIIIIMSRAATLCRPGSGRRRALENFGLVLVQFPVWWCLRTITPFIGSSRASKSEASRQPNAMDLHLPLSLPNDAFWSLKKQAPNAVAKFPKVRLCEGQTPSPLVFAFPSVHSVNRDIFAKVPRKLCERAGESQSACWRGWASKPWQKQ